MRSLLLALFLFSMVGCSTMDIVKGAATLAGPKSGINAQAELVVGTKEETLDTEVQVGDNLTAEVINNEEHKNVSLIYLILLVLGWLLPGPRDIYLEIKHLFSMWFRRDDGGE